MESHNSVKASGTLQRVEIFFKASVPDEGYLMSYQQQKGKDKSTAECGFLLP